MKVTISEAPTRNYIKIEFDDTCIELPNVDCHKVGYMMMEAARRQVAENDVPIQETETRELHANHTNSQP